MKLHELKNLVDKTLAQAGVDAVCFERDVLLAYACGITPAKALADPLCEVDETALLAALFERVSGRPLQYIVGQWEFFGLPFAVGEGVLIPRPDTECVVEQALLLLKNIPHPTVADLCSGSGCIAAAIAHSRPDATVFALEKSEAAFSYCRQNTAAYPNITPRLADVLAEPADIPPLDMVISNPPYIETDVVKTLAKEVQHEPKMALDGDRDGLTFYRAITALWKEKLKSGGFLVYEIGYNQTDAVTEILAANGFSDIAVYPDYSGNPRTVVGKKE